MKITEISPLDVMHRVPISGTDSLGRWFEGQLESLHVQNNAGISYFTLGIRWAGGGYTYADFHAPLNEQEIRVERHYDY